MAWAKSQFHAIGGDHLLNGNTSHRLRWLFPKQCLEAAAPQPDSLAILSLLLRMRNMHGF